MPQLPSTERPIAGTCARSAARHTNALLVAGVAVLVALIGLSIAGVAHAETPPPADTQEAPTEVADDADGLERAKSIASGAFARSAERSALFGAPPEQEGPITRRGEEGVTLSLVTDQVAVRPGSTIRVGMRFDLDENFHIYDAHNPGDLGLPTEVEWTLPEGFTADAPVWPAPELYREKSGDTSYVHHGDLLSYSTLTVPEDIDSESVEVGASYVFQVCNTGCTRLAGDLTLSLPVAEPDDEVAQAPWHARFEAAEAAQPIVSEDVLATAVSHTPVTPDQSVAAVIEVEAADGVDLETPDDEDRPSVVFDAVRGLDVETLELVPTADGGVRVVARISAGERFDPSTELDAIGATIQLDAHTTDGDGEQQVHPVAYRAQLPLALAGVGAEVSTSDSPLLESVDVAAITDPGASDGGGGRPAQAPIPLWQALLFALLGGLILNIMPCVLPVLSLKALSLVEEANESERSVRAFVGMYVLGVLASFWALAAAIIAIKYSGQLVGWGFQFQEPGYVLVMSAVIFAFALSLFGVFEIPGLTVKGEGAGGLRGSFIHGVLTTALSTPCSAPLLGSALTFALAQSPAMIMLSFTLIGVGLALPVSILTLAPRARKYIPRPGPWMETFKHVIAFLLIGTVVWLLGVLTGQVTTDAMKTVYVFLALVAAAAWVLGRWTGPLATVRSRVLALASAVVLIAGGTWFLSLELDESQRDLESDLIAWQAFEGEETLALAEEGKTLFIDFTADWCATCKANEAAAIETEAVSELIRDNGILPFKADLTRKNPELSRWVEHYGRSAIPLYVIVPAGKPDDAVILPEIITEGMLLEALREAGPSTDTVQTRVDEASEAADPAG